MANYDSSHTGAQIDEAVDIALGLTHTPLEIDNAIDTLDSISSTPADIDNAVDYIDALEDASVGSSALVSALGFIGRFTNTPEDIDATVDKFETVSSQPSQIDDTVDVVVDNNATAGDILTADGNGGCSWQTPLTPRVFYHHTAIWTKTEDADNSRFTFEWVDSKNASSSTAAYALLYIKQNFNRVACPKMALGCVFVEHTAYYINGIYHDHFDPDTQEDTFVLVGDDYPTTYVEVTSGDLGGWTYNQTTLSMG